MKSCVLCGACSWGGATDYQISQAMARVTFPETTLFVSCDNCGATANKVLLEDYLPMRETPPAEAGFPFAALVDKIAAGGPTRLERFVLAMLESRTNLTAIQLVQYCRDVLTELDAPPATVNTPKWLKLEFADEPACKTFLLSVIEPALERVSSILKGAMQETLHQRAQVLTNAVLFVLETHVIPDFKDAPDHG